MTGPIEGEVADPTIHLGWDGTEQVVVDANALATGRTCVIGASGSGKSYAVGVICEELCKNKVPFAIVDTEGEHHGLKDKYEVVWVGDEEKCDLQWSAVDLEQMAAQAPDVAPLILDLSETEEPRQKVQVLLSAIYKEVEKRRTPYLIVVEEADRFIPQNGERLAIFGEIARRGRKRGIGLMVCTQRPSLVDKNILSQCGNQVIGKLVIKNDLQAVAQFFQGHELPKHLTALPPGRFYVMGGLSAVPRCVSIREKETRHVGSTPRLGVRTVVPVKLPVTSTASTVMKDAKNPDGSLGFNPTFREEDIPIIVRRDKSFVLFGKEEVVTHAQLVFRPMVEVGVAIKAGVLKRRVEMRYLVLDGQTGRFVEIGDVPVLYEGLERLIGLDAEEIDILQTTKLDRDMSLLEIANKVGVSREMIRKPVRALEERRLVRSFQVGKTRLFRRVFSAPEFRWHQAEQALEPVEPSKARTEQAKLDEKKVREVIKGLVPYSDVQSYRPFVYPFYRVELVMKKRRKRVVWLDGRTAGEIRP
ncbi:MAG: DUF87 domain-containing protein [Thaumarchaeota archaeon]|nr:DUF87 domain-containing protein [Nitrososphaerota archaeon]